MISKYDGTGVTVNAPPNGILFDPASKRKELTDRSLLTPAPKSGRSLDVAPTADSGQVIASFMTSLSSLAQIMTSAASPRSAQTQGPSVEVSVPGTPVQAKADIPGSSPVPSPTQIPRYLSHVEQKLGVSKATALASEFMAKGWGPDIIANVPLNEIKEKVSSIGGTEGDAIRIQTNGAKWWKSSEAKRKRSNTQSSDHWVQYQTVELDGTMRGWPGNPPKRGRTTEEDRQTTYFDDRIGYRIPIAEGWTIGDPLDKHTNKGGDEGHETL